MTSSSAAGADQHWRRTEEGEGEGEAERQSQPPQKGKRNVIWTRTCPWLVMDVGARSGGLVVGKVRIWFVRFCRKFEENGSFIRWRWGMGVKGFGGQMESR
jgi:hypothetical protein